VRGFAGSRARVSRHRWDAAAVAACLLALALHPAAAQGPAPRKFQFDNGLRVVFQSNETTQTIVLCAFVRVTALHEVRQGIGIRPLTQRMLGRANGLEADLQRAAARIDVATAPDYVEVVIAAPVEAFSDCARILGQVLYAPQLDAVALETERARVLRGIAARGELPTTVALDAIYERLCPGLAAAQSGLGDVRAVVGLTLEQIEGFHATHYLPNCTVISVSGGTTAEECRQVLAGAMADLLPGGRPREPAPALPAEGPAQLQLDWPGASGVYAAGGRAVSLTSPAYPAAAVAMALLGSGMDARLYKALRRDQALAYTIVTDITPSVIAPSATVLVTCDGDKLAQVARVVEREIERLMTRPPADQELRRAKRYLLGSHALRHQRNRDIAHYLGVFELLGGAPGYRLDTLLSGKIAAVSAEAVRDATAMIFEQMVAVRLGGPPVGQ